MTQGVELHVPESSIPTRDHPGSPKVVRPLLVVPGLFSTEIHDANLG